MRAGPDPGGSGGYIRVGYVRWAHCAEAPCAKAACLEVPVFAVCPLKRPLDGQRTCWFAIWEAIEHKSPYKVWLIRPLKYDLGAPMPRRVSASRASGSTSKQRCGRSHPLGIGYVRSSVGVGRRRALVVCVLLCFEVACHLRVGEAHGDQGHVEERRQYLWWGRATRSLPRRPRRPAIANIARHYGISISR